MIFTYNDIQYCGTECHLQKSGELSVIRMAHGLGLLREINHVTYDVIINLGQVIEPVKNRNGIRKTPVFFRNFKTALKPELIEGALKKLLLINDTDHIPADIFYTEFENIHPFIDGNGRVGSLLYNFYNKTLDNPIMAPDVWGGELDKDEDIK